MADNDNDQDPMAEEEGAAADDGRNDGDEGPPSNGGSGGDNEGGGGGGGVGTAVVGSPHLRPVFLGNLAPSARAEDIAAVFERPFAPPDSDREYRPIPVDRLDYKRGYCFVFLKDVTTQEDKDLTESFVSEINGMSIPGVSNKIRSEFARGDGRIKKKEDERRKNIEPSDTLFVVNFHEQTTRREDLQMLFEPYGELVRIDMKRNYAFVQFKSIDVAKKAREATNGGKLDQSVLTVEFVARQRTGDNALGNSGNGRGRRSGSASGRDYRDGYRGGGGDRNRDFRRGGGGVHGGRGGGYGYPGAGGRYGGRDTGRSRSPPPPRSGYDYGGRPRSRSRSRSPRSYPSSHGYGGGRPRSRSPHASRGGDYRDAYSYRDRDYRGGGSRYPDDRRYDDYAGGRRSPSPRGDPYRRGGAAAGEYGSTRRSSRSPDRGAMGSGAAAPAGVPVGAPSARAGDVYRSERERDRGYRP